MAIDYNHRRRIGGDLGSADRKLVERNQHAVGQLGERLFPELAHVDQENGSPVLDLPGKIAWRDFQRHDGHSPLQVSMEPPGWERQSRRFLNVHGHDHFSFLSSFFSSIGSFTGFTKWVVFLSAISRAACASASSFFG